MPKKIEEQLKDLPIEIRNMKLKIASLEEDERKVFNSKIKLLEEIQILNKQCDDLKASKAKSTQVVATAEASAAEIIKKATAEAQEMQKKTTDLEQREADVELKLDNIAKREAAFTENTAKNKTAAAELAASKSEVAATKARLDCAIAENAKSKIDLQTQNDENAKTKATLEETLSKANESIQSAVDAKKHYEEKARVSKESADHNAGVRAGLDILAENSRKKQVELDEKEIELNHAIEQANAKEKSFEQATKEVQIDRQRVQVQELRVKKLIENNNLTKQLADMDK